MPTDRFTLMTLPTRQVAQPVVAPVVEAPVAPGISWKTIGSLTLVTLLAFRLALSVNGGVYYFLAVAALVAMGFIARRYPNVYLFSGAALAGVVFLILGVIGSFSGGSTTVMVTAPAFTAANYSAENRHHKRFDCEIFTSLGRPAQYRTCMNLPN